MEASLLAALREVPEKEEPEKAAVDATREAAMAAENFILITFLLVLDTEI